MNEETIGFAVVLLVAAASVFSVLILEGNSTTGQAYADVPRFISDDVKALHEPCANIVCPYGYPAKPVLDAWGRRAHARIGADGGTGNLVCECPVTKGYVGPENFVLTETEYFKTIDRQETAYWPHER